MENLEAEVTNLGPTDPEYRSSLSPYFSTTPLCHPSIFIFDVSQEELLKPLAWWPVSVESREKGNGKWPIVCSFFVRKEKAYPEASCHHLFQFHWPWLGFMVSPTQSRGWESKYPVALRFRRRMWERVWGQPRVSATLVEMLFSFPTQGLAVSIMSLSGLGISGCRKVRCIPLL